MSKNFYEQHQYEKPSFPVIFHYNVVKENAQGIYFHWHENIEILYFTKGKGRVMNGGETFLAQETDIAVINANSIHSIQSVEGTVEYHCLIVDQSFCEMLGFFTEDQFVKKKINDSHLNGFFDSIVEEMMSKRSYYESAVLSHISGLLLHLYRFYGVKKGENRRIRRQKTEMVMAGIKYIRKHFQNQLALDDIVSAIGYSKYHFMRTFKELTGETVVHYLNTLRVGQAQKLLLEGLYPINEIAYLCGFESPSYFTKVFKNYTGQLPSQFKNNPS